MKKFTILLAKNLLICTYNVMGFVPCKITKMAPIMSSTVSVINK